MTDTINLGLPCIEGSQAQKHVTHNDALRILDTLVQLAVLDRDLTAPPGSPTEGQRWIVKPTASGLWAGHDDAIAAWQDGAWQFSVPQTGWSAFVVDEGVLLIWNGTAWSDFFAAVPLQNLALLGVGTTADATNPLSAKLNNALFVAKTVAEGGSGDLRFKLSKESAAKTLSFLFQDNYSGRAEIGLAGDDDFHFKVSADGSTWVEALTLNKTSGAATLAASASATAFIPSGSSLPANGIYLPAANTVGIAANATQIWTGTTSTIAVKPTTASTSPTTGALTVAGGVGIAGAVYAGSTVTSLVPDGARAFIAKNSGATGNTQIALDNTSVSGGGYWNLIARSDGGFAINQGGTGDRLIISSAGAFSFSGALSLSYNVTATVASGTRAFIAKNSSASGDTQIALDNTSVSGGVYWNIISASDGSLTFNQGGVGNRVAIGSSGVLSALANVASTSTTTGTLVVTGGVGVSGKLFAGDAITAAAFLPSGSSVPANGIYLPAANTVGWATNSTARGKIDANGNFIFGTAALATNATNGFVYIPTCAGTPTGTPTAVTGMVPMIYDTTNHKLYIYDGGWKGGTAPGAWS